MSAPIGVLPQDRHTRPALHRTRSASSPTRKDKPKDIAAERISRPQHGRSHSLLPPGAILTTDGPKAPASSLEKPERSSTEKTRRIHLPGKHHLHHHRDESQDAGSSEPRRRSKIHRYTQSLAQHHHYTNNHAYHNSGAALHSSHVRSHQADSSTNDSLPHLVAGINAERRRHQHTSSHPSPADTLSPPGLSRVPTSHSYRGLGATDATHFGYSAFYDSTGRPTTTLRRRATSDPRSPSSDPQHQSLTAAARPPKTQIEKDLDRAARLATARKFALTASDVRHLDRQISLAEEELRGGLTEITQQGMEITRRLDYGYYNLLEKVGNLAGVIASFESLAAQGKALIENLDGEVEERGRSVRGKAEGLKRGFEEREGRVKGLEGRGREVMKRAEGLGERLERARGLVEQWEERERKRSEVWGRFVTRVWGMVGVLVGVVVAVIVVNEVWIGGGDGAGAGAGAGTGMVVPDLVGGTMEAGASLFGGNESVLAVGGSRNLEAVKERVPEDVKQVLVEIEERNRGGRSVDLVRDSESVVAGGTSSGEGVDEGIGEEPKVLRVFDEL